MIIALEGLDGVGKTTIARALALEMSLEFIEKPFQRVLDKHPNSFDIYNQVTHQIKNLQNPTLGFLFYLTGSMLAYQMYKKRGAVIDRFIGSNYTENQCEEATLVLKEIAHIFKNDVLGIILFAPADVRIERMKSRNPKDPDIETAYQDQCHYDKIINIYESMSLNYLIIDTSASSPCEIVKEIKTKIKKAHSFVENR